MLSMRLTAQGTTRRSQSPLSSTTPADTTAPSVPSGLTLTGVSENEVDIAWQQSSDNVAVLGYSVYRDGEHLGDVDAAILNYADTTAEPSSAYTYTVDAFDGPRNHSAQSAPLSVSTPPDIEPPSTPADLAAAAVSAAEIQLSWSASSDNFGVSGYTLYRDDAPIAVLGAAVTTYADTDVEPETSYTYAIDAFDGAGNHSPQSASVSATTSVDVTPPSTPAGLSATPAGLTQVDLAWAAATDNVGVTGYTLYRDGSLLATLGPATLTYSDTGLTASTTYSYTVDAFDAAGQPFGSLQPCPGDDAHVRRRLRDGQPVDVDQQRGPGDAATECLLGVLGRAR